eukprot:CAMPEP_0170383446 /NCGR_PEP_ID=MMETSP0117_2-20130122/15479_1 /TAXON_ID=400756 /ORGANISM="Durinskia baltica, Strain CSIRO CS-38" /LENGTH=336 /DNA_ID=CAMNT_0010639149 /DNA_START=144 /DNA_END=1154 /DNA_ORIENTATION=-
MAVPVAAMNALVLKLKDSKANTWMHLEKELRLAIDGLKTCSEDDLGGRSHISLGSGCELFMKYVTRAFNLEFMDFASCKEELLRRGERFADMSLNARVKIAELGHSFIQDDCTLLVHGVSRVVTGLILKAAESKHFNLIITESRPDAAGLESARIFSERGIPTKVVLDAAVGAIMEEVDLCLVGAEGVMENGGIVNKIGTYQIALVAKALQVPFYVAVESYKFSRMYPLSQRDVGDLSKIPDFTAPASASSTAAAGVGATCLSGAFNRTPSFGVVPSSPTKVKRSFSDLASALPANVVVEQMSIDFTPAKCITLLFTDIGVLTPAAVSDELIRLYQ